MKSNYVKIGGLTIALFAFGTFNPIFAQKGKKSNEKDILFMGFENLKDGETPAEAGTIQYGSSIVENGVSAPTSVAADLFSAKGSGDYGVPKNVQGIEDPIKEDGGDNFAGIYFYKPGKAAVERSYITIPINKGKEQQTLKKGLTYCIEFSVSLSESSKFAVNNIAAHLSKEKPGTGEAGPIYTNERVMKSPSNNICSGFFGWEKICNIYTAKGDEKFITIGNFDKNEATQFLTVKKPKDSEIDQLPHAYYFVDNVIIRLVDKPEDCPCFNSAPQKVEESYSTLLYTKTPELTSKMTQAEKIELHAAYFRFGKASFSDNAKEMMNYVIEEMKANPSMRIEISGHNDAKEDRAGETNEEYQDMARKRVAAVSKYFVTQGIDKTRLVESFKGAEVPNPEIDGENDDDELKDAKNRRVNFKIIK